MSFLRKVQKAVSPVAKGMGGLLNDMTGVTGQMDKSYAQQKAMMDLQNQYNSPAAQLARMAEAGIEINPTSYALGTGNLSNTSASGFAGSGSPAGNPITMAMGVAQGITGISEAKQRIANMKEQNINLMEQGNILFNQMEGSRLANDIARHNLTYAQDHHIPVNFVPSIDSSTASWVNELLTTIKRGTN